MKCEEARAALLSGLASNPVDQHLATCRLCRAEQPIWFRLRSTLSEHALWEEPPPDLADNIVRSIQGQHQSTQPQRQKAVLYAGLAATVLIAVAATLFATGGLTADWEMDLVTTAEAPEATAMIRGWSTARGTRMVLDVTGIGDAPSGFYYEIWMTAVDGRHISAGTFNGSGRVTAFAGVRRADYPRIWITLEAADDDLGPSPQTYFDTA